MRTRFLEDLDGRPASSCLIKSTNCLPPKYQFVAARTWRSNA